MLILMHAKTNSQTNTKRVRGSGTALLSKLFLICLINGINKNIYHYMLNSVWGKLEFIPLFRRIFAIFNSYRYINWLIKFYIFEKNKY